MTQPDVSHRRDSMTERRLAQHCPRAPQRGVIAIMFSVFLVVAIGFIGLAIDLSRVYNRNVELQTLVDVAALAAAHKLDGSTAGVQSALTAASDAMRELKYDYNQSRASWTDSAITFSSSLSAPIWMPAAAAMAAPAGLMFVKVDSKEMTDIGLVETVFIKALSPDFAQVSSTTQAIAGRSTISVTPLAICALSATPAASRPTTGELVQYGFRRGVGYDLMDLNPNGSDPEHFVINPIDAESAVGKSSNTTVDIVGPFVCTGSMPMGKLVNGKFSVRRKFPIDSLYQHLNSRFDDYTGGRCNHRTAPPDFNIKAYHYNTAAPWMSTVPDRQTAAPSGDAGKRWTIADSSGGATGQYGPLWSFARPVPFTAWSATTPEPKTGYLPFNRTLWPGLYAPGTPTPKASPSYPASGTPYNASGGTNFKGPDAAHGRGMSNRRVLNVALLACPVPAGTEVQATVLAIGRFFMTVPATSASIAGEFAGIASEGTLGGAVELYR